MCAATTEVIQNNLDILEVTPEIIDDLKRRALASPRKRSRLCMHRTPAELTHEMLIVFHKDTYMPPHRHPAGKSESYHIVDGSMTVFLFDDAGRVIRSIEMEKTGRGKPFLYRLSASIWHMPVPTSEWVVYHETYSGPFEKNRDVEFPSWAPKEHDREQVNKFLDSLPK
jgi:glucose-6-phosphate isomerase